MTKIRERLAACGPSIPSVELEVGDLEDPDRVLAKAGTALSGIPGAVRKLTESLTLSLPGGVSLDASGILERFGRASGGVAAVFIDEIQNVDPEGPTSVRKSLRSLHEGVHQLPIVPVLAGLGDSRKRLKDAGLSRLDPPFGVSVGRLPADEVMRSVALFTKRFRVTGRPGRWQDGIARWSDGWPMHVHNSLRALAGELAGTGGDLDRADLHAVRVKATEMRMEYYGSRVEGPLSGCRRLLGAVMAGIGDRGVTEDEVVDEIGRLHKSADSSSERIPEGLTAGMMFATMVASGLLQTGDGDFHSCPIPSLRKYCTARAAGRLHLNVMSGDEAKVRAALGEGADIGACDPGGGTALHLAVDQDWPGIARQLLEAGADPQARDGLGRTPADLASGRPGFGFLGQFAAPGRPPSLSMEM